MKILQEKNLSYPDLKDVPLTISCLNKHSAHWSPRSEKVGQKQKTTEWLFRTIQLRICVN